MNIDRECKALLLAAVLAVPGAVGAAEVLDRVIAIVEESPVLQSELEEQMAAVRRNLEARDVTLPPPAALEKQVLERMILDSLQLQRGERAGVQISDEELSRMMEVTAARQGLSLEALRQSLEEEGRPYRLVRAQLRQQMIIEEVQRGSVRRRVQLSEGEVERFLATAQGQALNDAQYHLLHLHLPLEEDAPQANVAAARLYMEQLGKQLQQGASPPPEGEQTQEGYVLRVRDLGWRTAAEVPTLVAEQVPQLAPGEVTGPARNESGMHLVQMLERRGGSEQIVRQTRVRHILMQPSIIRSAERTLQTLEDARRRLLAGEDFDELAKEFSEDPGSRQTGGDLGWVNPKELEPTFEEVMDATAEGDVSRVFRGTNGWHLLEVLERRRKNIAPEMIQQRARNILFERKYREELSAWLDEIRDEAYVELRE